MHRTFEGAKAHLALYSYPCNTTDSLMPPFKTLLSSRVVLVFVFFTF